MNNIKLREQLDYIPFIEYKNNVNDSFETNIIQINKNSLLYLPNLSPKSNKSESNNILCKKFKIFKKYLYNLFI